MRRPFHEVWALDVQMWLIAQMKAYSMLMRNFALICGLGHLCKGFFKDSMCEVDDHPIRAAVETYPQCYWMLQLPDLFPRDWSTWPA